ncbi:MAG: hydrogenase formation protein HypD [Bacillota bacterium]|nr:hydrogenase formation protein HypD [Bacillota bacterium]
MNSEKIIKYLKEYDGPEVKLMEVCGTHTAAIFKSGIRSLISPKIHLISGPGCPVCVTPAAYIDMCIQYAEKDSHVLYTFGDMIKVPGTGQSLAQAKGEGTKVELMFSPVEVVEKAKSDPDTTYVVAAVGFETTIPTYGVALSLAIEEGVKNIKFITALKSTIPAVDWICANEKDIDGFICPGHVSVITGSHVFEPLAVKYQKPFVVAGFEGEHLLAVIYDLVRQIETDRAEVKNLYQNAVSTRGNLKALAITEKYFHPGTAVWRGLGEIPDSGMYLRDEYKEYDAGSYGLDEDIKLPKSCRCADVIVGRINPVECPMFGKGCDPMRPYGPCMVSTEGACGIWYRNTVQ